MTDDQIRTELRDEIYRQFNTANTDGYWGGCYVGVYCGANCFLHVQVMSHKAGTLADGLRYFQRPCHREEFSEDPMGAIKNIAEEVVIGISKLADPCRAGS